MIKQFDLTVIGGGIVGLMTATLAKLRQPTLRLAVVEQKMLGFGVTHYSAAFSTPLSKSIVSQDLIKRGRRIIKEIQNTFSLNLIPTKCLYVVNNCDIDNFFDQYTGDDLTLINQFSKNDPLNAILKIPKNKRVFFAENSAHYVNIAEMIKILAAFLRENDCEIFESCRVCDLESKAGGRLKISCSNDFQVETQKAIFTLGPWIHQSAFLQSVASQDISRNKKVVALHLSLKPRLNMPAVVFYNEDAFLLPLKKQFYSLFSFASDEWNVLPESHMSVSRQDIQNAKIIFDQYSMDFDCLYAGERVFCDNYSVDKEFKIDCMGEHIAVIYGASGSGYRFSYGLADKLLEIF